MFIFTIVSFTTANYSVTLLCLPRMPSYRRWL